MTVHKNRSRHQRLPAFRGQRSGIIVNIASLTAEQGYPYNSVYVSSKAAVALLSECLNIELAEFGVVVRAILPGMSATRIFTKIDRVGSIPGACPGHGLVGNGGCSSHEEVGQWETRIPQMPMVT